MYEDKRAHKDEAVYSKREMSNMEMRKENIATQNTYKKASMADVVASMKKTTKQYDKALKNLAK